MLNKPVLEKLEMAYQFHHGFAVHLQVKTSEKPRSIPAVEKHILSSEDGYKRYRNAMSVLSQAFAIAIHYEEALRIKEEISFFRAVKDRLRKFEVDEEPQGREVLQETITPQVTDQALVSEKVVDIFYAAGIKKPDFPTLSDSLLQELKDMKHRNWPLALLEKLLGGEIKSKAQMDWVKGQLLLEQLREAIQCYHNKTLTAIQVIDKLISLSQEILQMGDEPQSLTLDELEYDSCSNVAQNQSAREVMQKKDLYKLVAIRTKKVRKDVLIDWSSSVTTVQIAV